MRVREHGDRETDAGGALQRQGMGGDLHRAGRIPIEHAPKRPLQVDRLGRRALHLLLDSADDPLHGAQKPGTGPVRLEDVADQEGGGRLPVGAGDAGDAELRRRVVPEAGRDRGHRGAGIGDAHLGHTDVQKPLDHERGGAAFDGALGELMAVRVLPGNAEEERARLDRATVVGKVGYLHLGVTDDLGDLCAEEQLAELHRGDSMAADPAGSRGMAAPKRGDLAEGGRRDDAAVVAALGLIDHHSDQQLGILRRSEAHERGDEL